MVSVWLFLYGLIYILSDYLSDIINIPNIITAPALFIFLICFLIRIKKSNYKEIIKIKPIKIKPIDSLIIIPLISFSILNLFYVQFKFDFLFLFLMISVCAIEEIFFRGFLLSYLQNKKIPLASIICALIFGLYHCVNLINTTSVIFTISQILCSFSAGFCYNEVSKKFDSLIPSYISHLLTNITAIGILSNVNIIYYISLSICFILNIGFGTYLNLKNNKKI